MSDRDIVWFREVGINDVPLVGGKGASLGEMSRANFPVPAGFIVTAEAYFDFIKSTGIKKEIVKKIDAIDVENTKQLEDVSKEIRELILRTKMNEELSIEIQKAYMKLNDKKIAWLSSSEDTYVAIRSSATAEDLPEASFAGQQDTYLNIIGKKEVAETVKQCWASLFTARAVYYRKKQGFSTEQVGIAVVVQKMINSESAGVMFTANPATGNLNEIIIEGAFGLGEAVVSGSLTPDKYVVEKGTFKILDKVIAEQEWQIVRAGRGSKKEEMKGKIRTKQKISDKQIIELAKIGKQIEKHYGKPQDIEWALEHGELFIVQSRPITTLKLGETKKEEQVEEGAKLLLNGLAASPGIVSGKVRVIPSVEDIEKVAEGDIIVTSMTTPDWVPAMEKSIAIITEEGGSTCHAAIVSRELGIPCIVGTENAMEKLKNGDLVTVDGFHGKIYEGKVRIKAPEKKKIEVIKDEEVDELEEVLEEPQDIEGQLEEAVEEKEKSKWRETDWEDMPKEELAKEKEHLKQVLATMSAKVKVNVALPDAAEKAAKTGADGVGLLRAEHMITAAGVHPAEYLRQGKKDELIKAVKDGIKKVAELFKGKPVWYRTFDARTDEFRHLEGGDKEPEEDNPMLGWHGIRRDLDEPELLKAQFMAIKELQNEGIKNVGIMLPFLHSVKELREAKDIAKRIGLVPGKTVDFGVMVETPASAWIIEELLEEGIQFISFGTNDLTQLTLGLDRNNEKIQKWFTELHPAILRQLEKVIKACNKAGVKSSICGQAASNPEMVRHLVRFGISSVSANIDAVQNIKNVVLEEEKKILLEQAHKMK